MANEHDEVDELVAAVIQAVSHFPVHPLRKVDAIRSALAVCEAGLEVEEKLERTGEFVASGTGMLRIRQRSL